MLKRVRRCQVWYVAGLVGTGGMAAGALLIVSLVGPQESTVMWVPPAQPELGHGVPAAIVTLAVFGPPLLISWYRHVHS